MRLGLATPEGWAARRRRTERQTAYVSREAVLACAAVLAAGAHARSGRSTMPGNEHLVAATGYKLRTVQLAVDALEAMGALVKIREGKDRLTKDERLELHAQGSRARRFRAVYSCTLSSLLASLVVKGFRRGRAPGRTNPRGLRPSNDALAPLGPPHRKTRRRSPTYAPPVHALAEALSESLRPVRRASHWALLPALKRYALAGWQARHIVVEIDALHRRLGWSVPDDPADPARWLGGMLRRLDPADNPHLYDAAMHAADRGRRGSEREGPCAHGQPGGMSTMNSGLPRCPICRAQRR